MVVVGFCVWLLLGFVCGCGCFEGGGTVEKDDGVKVLDLGKETEDCPN